MAPIVRGVYSLIDHPVKMKRGRKKGIVWHEGIVGRWVSGPYPWIYMLVDRCKSR